MADYYEQDNAGKWKGMRTPEVGFTKPPTCPTCRAAIKCPRYGRIFKRADLDIQENNIASHMSKLLSNILRRMNTMDEAELEANVRGEA